MNKEVIESLGYFSPKLLSTGEWAALGKFIFTTGLLVGIDEVGYRTRFCYKYSTDALIALNAWDGVGDPPGNWIKEKGSIERNNPNLNKIKDIPIITEKL